MHASGEGFVLRDGLPAEALRPYSPVAMTGTRQGSPDIALTRSRRTRIPSALSDGAQVPLGETAEPAEIEGMNGGTVVRTVSSRHRDAAGLPDYNVYLMMSYSR